jgi:hypothetical protein
MAPVLAISCGSSENCTNPNLIAIKVEDGTKIVGFDPEEYYASAGAFPHDPAY